MKELLYGKYSMLVPVQIIFLNKTKTVFNVGIMLSIIDSFKIYEIGRIFIVQTIGVVIQCA